MMKIEIYTPLALHEIGQRNNNEDSIFPSKGGAHEHDRLFLVCDGIGGNAKGEEASGIVCEAFDYRMESGRHPSNPANIADALAYAEEQIDTFVKNNPLAKGMGTTMTLLHLHENGATLAHVGDSRIYHIRDRTIRFVTSDHKWVNKLVLSGDLTPEEASIHPNRNIIDRAILGSQEQSTHADVMQITDIRAGDYFFLCTDGILEGLEENQLVHILASDFNDTQKLFEIEKACQQNSRDNFSAYLVRIKSSIGVAMPWTSSVIPQKGEDDIILAISGADNDKPGGSTYSYTAETNQQPAIQATLPPPPPASVPPPNAYAVDEYSFQKMQRNEKQKLFQGIVIPVLIVVLCPLAVLGGFHFYKQFVNSRPSMEQSQQEAKPADQQPQSINEERRPMTGNSKEDRRAEPQLPNKKKDNVLAKPTAPDSAAKRLKAGKKLKAIGER